MIFLEAGPKSWCYKYHKIVIFENNHQTYVYFPFFSDEMELSERGSEFRARGLSWSTKYLILDSTGHFFFFKF